MKEGGDYREGKGDCREGKVGIREGNEKRVGFRYKKRLELG